MTTLANFFGCDNDCEPDCYKPNCISVTEEQIRIRRRTTLTRPSQPLLLGIMQPVYKPDCQYIVVYGFGGRAEVDSRELSLL